ncbi:MAG TPA: GNAT family N-acetyltransferase [Acidobacteriaceae bacterium]
MNLSVEHREAEHRFLLEVEGAKAELTYRMRGRTIVFDHTGVPPQLRHRGLANQLAQAGLAYARQQQLQVDPQCRFMAVYLKRHPEFCDLLQPAG